MKIGIPEIGAFSAIYYPSIANLKLKFWGYNENKYGLSFDTKKYYFRLSPGSENAMGTWHI